MRPIAPVLAALSLLALGACASTTEVSGREIGRVNYGARISDAPSTRRVSLANRQAFIAAGYNPYLLGGYDRFLDREYLFEPIAREVGSPTVFLRTPTPAEPESSE